jgi:hypothetical protein
MRPKKESPVAEVVRRLDLIISLLLDRSAEGSKANMTDKIMKLAELGASPAQIGEILGRPVNYVTAATSMRKKGKHRG